MPKLAQSRYEKQNERASNQLRGTITIMGYKYPAEYIEKKLGKSNRTARRMIEDPGNIKIRDIWDLKLPHTFWEELEKCGTMF